MTPKNTAVAVGLVVALVVGYFFFFNPSMLGMTVQGTNQAPVAEQGKLDINAVCEGALAYMTFPDAASAEVFVAECKEGKHPEVIEQYKAQMGLGAGAEI